MKTTAFYLFAFLFTINMFSQHEDRERIKTQKIAFITDRLNLTPKEAQKFWPTYNAYDDKITKIRHEDMQHCRKETKENLNSFSDEEAKQLLDKMINSENELHRLSVELMQELKKILPAKKIIQLKIAEKDFHKILLEQYKKKHPMHKP